MTRKRLLAIGTYTERAPHVPNAEGLGIVLASFDEDSGDIHIIGNIADLRNPTYLDWNSNKKLLSAITEEPDNSGEFRFYSLSDGKLIEEKSPVTGPGRGGCHLVTDSKGKACFGTSYSDGTLIAYRFANNREEFWFKTQYKGTGPDSLRQEASHAHQGLLSPDERYLYVCDLGSDRIWLHDLTNLAEHQAVALEVPAGYGPRHLAFDQKGAFAFILCELEPRLLAAEVNRVTGELSIQQDLPTVDEDSAEIAAPAAVKVHPSGKTVAVSNRFCDTITLFSIERDGSSVRLEKVESLPAGGQTPRDMSFSPDGSWLLIANQDSSHIDVVPFKRDTGRPDNRQRRTFEVGTPVCIVFLDSVEISP